MGHTSIFGRVRKWTYDPSGNIAEYIDFDSKRWIHDYGAWHFLRGLTNPLGAQIRYTFTDQGAVSSCTDAGGTRSEYHYDLKDRLVQVRRHDMVRETYTRDAAGNLLASMTAMAPSCCGSKSVRATFRSNWTFASGDEHTLQYHVFGRFRQIKTKQDLTTFSCTISSAIARLTNATAWAWSIGSKPSEPSSSRSFSSVSLSATTAKRTARSS